MRLYTQSWWLRNLHWIVAFVIATVVGSATLYSSQHRELNNPGFSAKETFDLVIPEGRTAPLCEIKHKVWARYKIAEEASHVALYPKASFYLHKAAWYKGQLWVGFDFNHGELWLLRSHCQISSQDPQLEKGSHHGN